MKPGIQRHPPPSAKTLFSLCAGTADVDDLLGDLDELFYLNLDRMPPWRAKLTYWRQVISLAFSYAITSRKRRAAFHPYSNNSIHFTMIRNYFRIAWRMMLRNQVYTLINVLGLTLGIGACIIVYLVVSYELSFDRFHADKERIYRIKAGDEQNRHQFCTCIQAPGYTTFRDNFTGAEALTGYHQYDAKVTIPEERVVNQFDRNTADIILTDPEYFRIFQYQWLAGDPSSLAKPLNVVLTQSRARTYFGSIEPQALIGRSVIYNDSLHVSVAGIVKDWTENSDFAHTEFISFSTIENTFLRNVIQLDNWGMMMHSSQSFIKLKPGDDPDKVAAALTKTARTRTTEPILFQLEPLTKIHFRMNDEGESSMLSTLYALTGLAAFILLIAAINFINLSTAQSIRRTKEIGIRKVMGSQKFQLVYQFLSETFLLTFVALCLSLLLVRPLLTVFATYLPGGITFDPLAMNNWLFLILLLVATALLAGTYPALVVSGRAPALSLSGRGVVVRGRERWPLRKILIVFQFTFSLFFIIATLVISSQMNFIRHKDRGFSTTSAVTFNTNWNAPVSKVAILADRLRRLPGIEEVAMQGSAPMGFAQWQSSFEYTGKKDKLQTVTSLKVGDEHYLPLYKLRLLAGRNFYPYDTASHEIVVNESFTKTLGLTNPQQAIGEQIRINRGLQTICGVVQDFHEQSFRNPIGPCVIVNERQQEHSIALRLAGSDPVMNAAVIAKVESEFKALYPDETFSSHYIEDEIGWMHEEEQKTASLATIAMGITIFISCMGVFGLAMFTAAMRTREIGIRKVLGASVTGIVSMLSREFMLLILVSVVLATPIAWYYMNDWLLGFTYRTELSAWFFVASAAIALGTGLITVSFQSFKAATEDPVKAIKTE